MMTALKLTSLLCFSLLLLAGPAHAASPLKEIEDFKQPVAAGSAVTYADLLKLVFPERTKGQEEAPQAPPVRSLGDYFKTQPLTVKQGAGSILALPIKAEGRRLLLLLVAAEGERPEEGEGSDGHYNLLALFQTTPAPKLLDLLDLSQGTTMGMSEGFWCKNPLISLTPGTHACMIAQEHFNSSESFLQINLLWVRNGRLEQILDVLARGWKGLWETVTTKPVFWTEPDKGQEFPKVVARLTLMMKPTHKKEEEDEFQRERSPWRPGFTRSYRGTWRWDPAKQKYQQVSGDLEQLYKWYEKYY